MSLRLSALTRTCVSQRLLGPRNVLQDTQDECVGGDRVGKRFVRQRQAVAQYIGGQIRNILGQHVGYGREVRERACALDQVDRRARTCAKGHVARHVGNAEVVRIARCRHEPDSVAHQRRIDVSVPAARVAMPRARRWWRRRPLPAWRRLPARRSAELLSLAGIAHQDFHHEPVHLRLRQWIRALGFDGNSVAMTRNGCGTRCVSPAIVT